MKGGQRFATTQWIINQRAARTLRVEQQALNHQGRSVLVGTTIKQLTVRHFRNFLGGSNNRLEFSLNRRIEEYISKNKVDRNDMENVWTLAKAFEYGSNIVCRKQN